MKGQLSFPSSLTYSFIFSCQTPIGLYFQKNILLGVEVQSRGEGEGGEKEEGGNKTEGKNKVREGLSGRRENVLKC